MSIWFFIVIIPVLIIPIWAKFYFDHRITLQEFGINIAVGVVLVALLYWGSTYNQLSDTEYLNGSVTEKTQERVSCSHSYQCRCRTVSHGSGKNRTTSRTCDTCYDHSFDYDWLVSSQVGNFTIDRVDRQGTREPARWTAVQIGDPVTLPHNYTNYIKANPDSLFGARPEKDVEAPEYPRHYDYQYSDRVLTPDMKIRNIRQWNDAFAHMNARLGPSHHVNVVMVVTKSSERYAETIRRAWLGGKKNDVIIVVGAPRYPEVSWVRVMSWSQNDMINVHLRNSISGMPMNVDTVVPEIESSVEKYYVRRPMKDFEYLAKNIEPSMWMIVLMLILGTACSGYLVYYFKDN